MEKYNNWKLKFYTIWAGQAVSLITSAILQMAIIFYLTEKTGSAMVLSMASLVGFLPYAVFGPAIGVLVDRHDGLILSGFFADRIGVNHWFLLSGILIICIAIVCPMITEIRKLDAK